MRPSDSTEDVFADDVEIESLGTRVPVFVAWPRSRTKRPGILVCPEVWGVTKHIKEVVRRFATQGYMACAPEIFSRHGDIGTSTRYSERLKRYMATPEEEMVADAQAALRYLRALPMTESSALATVGFSMGGRLAGIVAATNREVLTSVIFCGHIYYEGAESGGRTWMLDLVPRLSCPTLFLYGDADELNPPSHIELLRNRVEGCDLPSEFVLYPGAGHSFFNEEGKTFDPAAAADAWGRVLTFLGKHVPGLGD